MRRDLPTGTVTFLFTDVDGSTRLLDELGTEQYAAALAEHRRVIREACAAQGGVEVDTQGDAFFLAFPTAPGALAAAGSLTEALASGPIRVRVGLHTGTPLVTDEGYVGGDVHRAARIAAVGHGGQVLVSASTAQLVELELSDLGEHRLKDLSEPERLFQLGESEFPALTSLYRTNLPVPSTPFLGRARELQEVVELLSGKDARLLTLTGPGGTGKTRLAAQAAGLAADGYPDGVWWVPLAPLRDPRLVLETAAQVVGSKNGLASHIADKAMLLLFDNFEQVVEAAPDVASLLADCPRLELLVTSREPLHVTGEQEYPVPPLVHEEGVGFFLARAKAVRPEFQGDEAVSEICRRLDDLPLALELAAARVKALSSAQILERLDERLPLLTGGARDLPERQRTLRATIEWSYDLLSEDEQRLFARLAVFSGGCTLEAAEQVCETHLDTLQSLVEKNLLRFSDGRYSMLETIREYASEWLELSGEVQAVRQRHAEHLLALAEEVLALERTGGGPAYSQAPLEVERDNIRAALRWATQNHKQELTRRLVLGLWTFWGRHLTEAEQWISAALVASASPQGPEHVRLLILGGFVALQRGDSPHAESRLEAALAQARQLGDGRSEAQALIALGGCKREAGKLEEAASYYEESAVAYERIGNPFGFSAAIAMLGETAFERGEYGEAASRLEEALSLKRQNHDAEIALVFVALARLALVRDDVEEAMLHAREALRTASRTGIGPHLAAALNIVARSVAAAGDPERATRLLSASETLLNETGGVVPRAESAERARTIAEVREALGDARFDEFWRLGAEMSVEEAAEYALAEN